MRTNTQTYSVILVLYNVLYFNYKLKHTTLGSVISIRENLMPSRPSPEFFTPPKGIPSIR